MSCRKYINKLSDSEPVRQRLEEFHNSIFGEIAHSGAFKRWNGLYFLPEKGTNEAYSQAQKVISDLNTEYGVPVADTSVTAAGKEYVFVNVKNLLERAEASIKPETLFENGKKDITFVRHALTQEDLQGKNSGQNGEEITQKGKEATIKTANQLKKDGVGKIYSSPTLRAVQTADIIQNTVNIPYTTLDGLAAWNIGSFAGKPEGNLDERYWVEHPDEKIPNGESFNDFKDRTISAMRQIQGDQSKFAVLTHSKTLGLIEALQKTSGIWNKEAEDDYLKEKSPKNDQISTYSWNSAATFAQKKGLSSSKASEPTISLVKEFLKRIGVNIEPLKDIQVNGEYADDAGIADMLNDLIYVADGKTDVALTEEAMHFAVGIIKQTHPELYKEMLKEIGNFNIYRQVLNLYKGDKNYQIEDGKPDIAKIKEETIGKILAETVILMNEGQVEKPENMAKSQSWWQKIVEWLKGLFAKPGFNPFQKAAEETIFENIGTSKDLDNTPEVKELGKRLMDNISSSYEIGIKNLLNDGKIRKAISTIYDQLHDVGSYGTYDNTVKSILSGNVQLGKDILYFGRKFLQKEPKDTQDAIYSSLQTQAAKISKPEGDQGKYKIGDKEVKRRVTDITKRWYDRIFGDKEITKSDYQVAIDEIKKNYGTEGHADIEHAFHSLVGDDGYIRVNPTEEEYTPRTNKTVYKILLDNLKERLGTFPDGTKFLSETMIYDPKRDIAGTIDFLAIEKTGKVNILDWKFMDLNTTAFEDVPWYKKKAFRLQIGEYKRILSEAYGVPLSKFGQTRAIPIRSLFISRYRESDHKKYPVLSSVEIGNIKLDAEKYDYLLPVGLENESTGDPKLDTIVRKLNGLREKIENRPSASFEEKFAKAEQLRELEKASRYIQIKMSLEPLIEQAGVFNNDVKALISQFDGLKDRNFDEIPKSDLSIYGKRLVDAFNDLSIYTNLDNETKHLFKDRDEKGIKSKVYDVVAEAREVFTDLEDIINRFGEKIANAKGEFDITDPEVAVSWNRRMFNETSKIPTKNIRTLYEYRREAQNKINTITTQENNELLEINTEYEKLAKSKGLGKKNHYSLLVKNDKHELIDQYEKDFYKQTKTASKEKDIKWIRENVDIEAYKTKLSEDLQKKLDLINARPWDEKRKNEEITRIKEQYSTATPDSYGWFLHYNTLRQFPLDKWETKEWKTLNTPENKVAKDLYDWIIKINQKADDIGYLPQGPGKSSRVFLPVVPKSIVEAVLSGGKPQLMERLMRSITVDEDTVGYGAIDKVTGQIINRIPRYLIADSEKELSDDLVKNLALYNEFVNRYKELADIEGIILALGLVEKNKGSIITSYFSKPRFNRDTNTFETQESNDKNSNLYNRQVSTLIYGQKYVSEERFDSVLGNAAELGKKINKVLHFKLLPEDYTDRQLSLNKGIDTLNNFFQMKTLGLSLLPALSNYLGGNFQVMINAGKYFTKIDVAKGELQLMGMAISGDQGKKIMGALKFFIPFTRDLNKDLLKKLSISPISSNGISDFLMSMMRIGDKWVEGAVFVSILNNTILKDGEMHNAREYIRTSDEFKSRYENGELKKEEASFEKQVDKLLEEYGLMKQIQVKGDSIKIPGIDELSPEVFKIANLTKALAKRVLGNMSQEEVRGISQNIIGSSIMIFKNWVPPLLDVRFGKLKYSSDIEAYEWGRMRSVFRVLALEGLIPGVKKLIASVKGTQGGIESLNKLYEYKKQKYYEETGQHLKMEKEDFYDMVRSNIRQQAKDVLMTAAMLTAYFVAKATPPDRDEDPLVKSRHKFIVRALDKFSDEVSFYYSFNTLQQLMGGSIFPSMGVLSEFTNVLYHFGVEMYGLTFDEKVAEKNKVLKYLMKSFPVTAQLSSYMPLYAPGLAKSLGINISPQANFIR